MEERLDHADLADPPARGQSRDLRAMVGDGTSFSIMVGLGEAYLPAFALAAGYGDAVAGWLATLPMLVGGLLQLITPYAVARLRSFRAWVVACALLQAASFLPLALVALTARVPVALLFLCSVLYWGSGMSAGPAWNTWADSLVPIERRARFFAHRARWSQAALLLAVVVGGFALELGRQNDRVFLVFAGLFVTAAIARGTSAGYLARQSERPDRIAALRPSPPWTAWRKLRGGDAKRLLVYLLAAQVAVHAAAPFFTPYMLGTLALSYGEYTLLTATAFGARIAVLPLLGHLAHTRGNRTVLWLGAFAIVPLPALWLVSDALLYLMTLQVLSGCAWACLELSTLLSFFEDLPPEERTNVLSAFNLANACALAAGALFGGACLRTLGPSPATYAAIFVLSTLGRALALLLLRRVVVPDVPLDASALRTLAVRPSMGAMQRPILAALPEEEDEPDPPRGP